MISKTKLKSRAKKKTNPELSEIIELARKNEAWLSLAAKLSGSTRNQISLNLQQLDSVTSDGLIVIPGKILSKGNLTKKMKLSALSISERALEKLKDTKSEFVPLKNAIEDNPKAEGVLIL